MEKIKEIFQLFPTTNEVFVAEDAEFFLSEDEAKSYTKGYQRVTRKQTEKSAVGEKPTEQTNP